MRILGGEAALGWYGWQLGLEFTVEGVSSGEGKRGDCVTTPPTPAPGEEEGRAPRGHQLSPQAPGALLLLPPVRSSLLISPHPEAQRRWRKV